MDTIQSMRKLLSVYSESLKSQTIMESAQADIDFISIVNEIKDSIMIAKSDLPAHVPMLNPSEIFSMGIDSDMTDPWKEINESAQNITNYIIGGNDEQIRKLDALDEELRAIKGGNNGIEGFYG